MHYVYEDFRSIEDIAKKTVPHTLYKYRDWSNSYHQNMLTKNELWLSHPKTLNDEYDIQTPLRFNPEEINHPIFLKKIQEGIKFKNPLVSTDSREFQVLCENLLEVIQSNENYCSNNYKEIVIGDSYDVVGVLCLGESCTDAKMWGYYSSPNSGFCVGFNTVELMKFLKMNFGPVKYSSKPLYGVLLNRQKR